jgi:hypothetical protein
MRRCRKLLRRAAQLPNQLLHGGSAAHSIPRRKILVPKKKTSADRDTSLRQHLLDLLAGGHAHATFDAAIRNLPPALRGKRPKGAEHSPWEVLEHMRIAQWDILEFSRNAAHQSPEWPSGYWPPAPAPPDAKAWDKSVRAFRRDLKATCDLAANPAIDLYARIPHGDGQTILKEALLVADHNAYHLGELVLLRRLLGAW